MFWTDESDGVCGGSSVGIAMGKLETVVIARDRCEAVRYGSLLEEMGIASMLGETTGAAGLGVPIFVETEELDRAGEILSALHVECAWGDDEEEDDFEDEDDEEEEEEEEEFLPDDMDDDFEEEEEDEDEEDEDEDL